MARLPLMLCLLVLGGLPGCMLDAAQYPPLATVAHVDVDRYGGRWYEIARYPAPFQRGCVNVTADYALRDDGKVDVLNTCGAPDGSIRSTIRGVARVVDTETNAKLAVSFGGLFEGAYWVIGLDDDYQWAVVGEPSRTFLWILSRTPEMDEGTLQMILATLPDLGYDPARLEYTSQAP